MDVDIARTWDAQAARFDDEPDYGLRDPAVRRAWGELLLEHVPAGSTVLDLGCGTGSLAVLLAEQDTPLWVSTCLLGWSTRRAPSRRRTTRT